MKRCNILFLPVILTIAAVVCAAEAKVTLLPDYINANPFKDRINDHTAKKYQTLCENYAGVTQAYAQSNGLVCNDVFSPAPNLVCYRDCGCDISYRYTSANCRSDEGRKLGGGSCNGLYKECNCDTSVYTYTENDSRCASKNFSGICKGSNGTFYRSCDDPCAGLTEANCVVNGVDYGCAATYGNGCDLCESCNINTCNLPENINKPIIATECNGCTTPVPGCSSKCESGCGKCEANCSGYRYDSPSAILYVNETYDCVLCGGSIKYKAKSCITGYKVDDATGGCVPMECDEYLAAEGYAVVENQSQFEQAIAAKKQIVIKKDLTASGTYTSTQNIYDYAKVKTLGYAQCPNSSAKLTVGSLALNKSGGILEVYPEMAPTTLNIKGNTQLYGGISGTPTAINLDSGVTLSLLGVKTYAAGSKLSGTGTVTVGPASTLNATTTNMSISRLRLQIGACAIQDSFEVCGGTSEADISFSGTSYLPSRCSTSSWSNGKTTCKGSIYTNCSVGSTPVDLRSDTDRNSICMITNNTRVAKPVLASGGTESYSLISAVPTSEYRVYCARCEAKDGCDELATTCYREAESQFPNCFTANQNPSYCMGTIVKNAKDICDQNRSTCRGEDSCGVQWAEGKAGTVVVKNAEDLMAAVAQSNISTVVIEADISLTGALNVPAGKMLLGAAGSTVGCTCEESENAECSSGKYRLLVNGDATADAAGSQKLTIAGKAELRDLGIETYYRTAINPNVAAVYVNSAEDVTFNNVYVEGNEGYGIQDVSSGGSGILLRGETLVNGSTAVKGKAVSSADTGTKLQLAEDAQVVVTGYDKGIDGIETFKMTAGNGMFTRLRINAKSLGMSLYNTDGAVTPYSYVDFATEGGTALLFKNMSGVSPVWPYNTKMRLEGNTVGIYSEGNRTLKISGDFDFKNTSTASSSKAVESEGSLTIKNEGYTGEGVVKMEAYTANPLIDVKNIFETDSYLQLYNRSAGGIGIRAAHVTFGSTLCYKPLGSESCQGFFSKSADINAETGIELTAGTSAVNGQLTFKKGSDVNLVAEGILTATAIKLNENTGMTVEDGSAVNIEMDKGVTAAAGAVSTINGDFSVTATTKAFSGGSYSVAGVLTAGAPSIFADGAAASFVSNGVLMLNSSTVNIASDTSTLIMPGSALLVVNFEESEDEEGGDTSEQTSVDRNTLFNNGLYGLDSTQLTSYYDGENMVYAIKSNCAASETACSMATFRLGSYIASLGGGSGSETDSKGNSLTKLSTCPALFTDTTCDIDTGTKSISCPYDETKLKCYGVINSNRSLAETEGRTLPLYYFEN